MSDIDFCKKMKDMLTDNDFVSVWNEDKWYSYIELWSMALGIADEIKKRQIERVVAILENGLEMFVLYFSAMLLNITIVPIDPKKSDKEIEQILSENQNALIIKDKEIISSWIYGKSDYSYEETEEKISNIDLKKIYMITYTSGSTGHPKGVKHNLKSLFMAGISFGNAVGLNKKSTMCHVMPMSYMAGILNTIFMPLICGSRIVIMPRFDVMSAVGFWKTVEKRRVNAFWLSPTMLNILMTVDRKGRVKEYLRDINPLFFIGTAPLYENIRVEFESRYEVRLLQSYGLSETLFLSTEVPNKKGDVAAVGYILPEVELVFGSDDEIKVDVPWMFLGYSNESTENYFEKSRYLTGDLGEERDGMLYITGRKKDLIVKGGMNISPRQIEDCIVKKDGIIECAVSGMAQENEERIVCWYVAEDEEKQIEKVINRSIEEELGKHCKIDFFVKMKEIPKNLNGKADKRKLVEEFMQ